MTQALLTRFETDTLAAESYLDKIAAIDHDLNTYFKRVLRIENSLTRQMVSFQANKVKNAYRWYKYKEAFSADLVEYLLQKYKVPKGKILDPFAGVGTTLFTAAQAGYSDRL